MTEPYYTEDAKMAHSPFPKWTLSECQLIHNILTKKGYYMNCVSRMGCDRKYHDAWEVKREDIPQVVEQLFRQRLVVEVQAEGHGKASVNFVYDYAAETIIDAVKRFQKNKKQEVKV